MTVRNITRPWPRSGARWPFAILLAALTAGCATTEEPYTELERAEQVYSEAQATPRIDQFARDNMQQAERNLGLARSAAEEGDDRDAVTHYSFLAERHVEIAQARLNRRLVQEQIENADRRRQELMLTAQQSRTTQAQQRAEEAEARLALTQQELEDLKVKQDERGTVFTLSGVVFDVDSDQMKRGGERSVTRIAETLKNNPRSHILVEGFTDSTGSDQYNAELSERRAKAVKAEFVKAGIPEDRIRVEGHGEEYPVASNDTPQGRQMNRRVEIVVSDTGRPVEPRGS